MNESQTTNGSALRDLDDRLVEIRREAEELLTNLSAAGGDLETALRAELERRPYTVLGVAAALGYVAGGGLPSRLTALVLTLGARVGLEYASRQLIARLSRDDAPIGTKTTR